MEKDTIKKKKKEREVLGKQSLKRKEETEGIFMFVDLEKNLNIKETTRL